MYYRALSATTYLAGMQITSQETNMGNEEEEPTVEDRVSSALSSSSVVCALLAAIMSLMAAMF